MKRIISALLLFSLLSLANGSPRKPNVILFLVDDLGWADLSLTGSKFHETPNIEQLAQEGVFFDNAYAASSVCTPTRGSILTGQYPSRLGMSYISGTPGPSGIGHKLTPPPSLGNVPSEHTTIAEALKEHGYSTCHIGKWHMQNHTDRSTKHYPEHHGFDLNIGGHRLGQPGSYYYPFESAQHPDTNVLGVGGSKGDYLTDVLTDQAIEYIKNQGDAPFFLNFWYYTVHTPIHQDKTRVSKYTKKAKKLGLSDTPESRAEHKSYSRITQDHIPYATMVESMDANIGRVLETLKSEGLDQDTIIVFMSDNGGLSTGSAKSFPACSEPLRAGKAWLYEGGIRSPMIIKYPHKVKTGLVDHTLTISNDLFPTILDLADLPLLPQQHLDGLSLAPILTQQGTLSRDTLFFHFPHYHHINTMGPAAAIRKRNYKLIEVFETGVIELYNLEHDLGEQTNLASKHPKLVKEMLTELHTWQKNTNSQPTTPNPKYQPEKDWRSPENSPKE